MIPLCSGCGGPPFDRLTVHYQYPRPEPIWEAADPWHVLGSAPLRTCGSPACGAAALLAVLDEIITNTAVYQGHLLNREDLRILEVGHPEDLSFFGSDPGEES